MSTIFKVGIVAVGSLALFGCSSNPKFDPPPAGYTAQEWARKTWDEEAEAAGYDKMKFAPLWRDRTVPGWENQP